MTMIVVTHEIGFARSVGRPRRLPRRRRRRRDRHRPPTSWTIRSSRARNSSSQRCSELIDASYLAQFREPEGYLDFARFGPPSHAGGDRHLASDGTGAHWPVRPLWTTLMREEQRVKAAVARLCRTDTDHVVLVAEHVSLGLFQAAFGAVAARCMYSAAEFPANTYPWVRAERPAVDRARLPGGTSRRPVAEALTPRGFRAVGVRCRLPHRLPRGPGGVARGRRRPRC